MWLGYQLMRSASSINVFLWSLRFKNHWGNIRIFDLFFASLVDIYRMHDRFFINDISARLQCLNHFFAALSNSKTIKIDFQENEISCAHHGQLLQYRVKRAVCIFYTIPRRSYHQRCNTLPARFLFQDLPFHQPR